MAACDGPGARAPLPPPADPPMISRAHLFGEATRHDGQLSPRGDRVAFLAPRDGVTNLWVLSVGALDEARAVTDDRGRGVRRFVWAEDNATLLYLLDERGDENWRLYAVAADGASAPRALTPAGARADILGISAADPGGVVVTLNQRDAAYPDLYRIDIATGARTLMQRNANTAAVRGFSQFLLDNQNRLRIGVKALADGRSEVFVRDLDGRWRSLFVIPFEDALISTPLAIEGDGRTMLMLTPLRDRVALVRVDLETGAKTGVGENENADVVDVWLDPTDNAPEAYASEYLRREWRAIDGTDAQADLDFLSRQLSAEFRVVSRSRDDARWIVVEEGPTTAARSYLYERGDRTNRRLSLLFRHRPGLEQAPLQPMAPVEIAARDGQTLVSYLTLPVGSDANGDARPETPAPLVIVPHDGPWTRDSYGFNPMHQWLANRGYGVLSVNFRGSAGFGRGFLNAGNREWGGRMQEDVLDAVQWAISNGVTEADRVAIVGSGYGGYAALAGLVFTPQQFRCGASFGAPVHLASMLEAQPRYLGARRDETYLRVGDPRLAEGRQMLRERSPLTRAGQVRRPLLIALGGRDPRASRGETDLFAQYVRGRRAGLTYLYYPEDGAQLRDANRLAYLAVLEHFLGGCLGGRVEAVGAFEGASMVAYDNGANVPGLSAFLRRPAAPAPAAPAPEEAAPPPAPAGGAGGAEEAAPPGEDGGDTP